MSVKEKIEKLKIDESEQKKFENFIVENDHPCLMAQSVVKQGHFILQEYGELGKSENVPTLLADLEAYLKDYDFEGSDFFTFVAVFKGQKLFTEKEFEERLWKQLQALHEGDSSKWDSTVSSNPQSPEFSFSLLSQAFYLVGMHPNSSRIARQSPSPTVVFNLHYQFEKLRELGGYKATRDAIRERDKALQGSINPMVADFGQGQEAPQYSGRKVGENWKCPFHHKHS
ncbi:guanitoxin biosynthesis heme-dependent pre-guanitoxin N-hydroxylase GntA [Owenweeksia hongkongensis]|uniref:guanitoxin biosynthesis heme-dependent pre-guanitoxin N-hydroxylase GntA n=1 Tax=Owenweeksia hongkongensis TaxID=253245 RepID=UPI003A8DD3A4